MKQLAIAATALIATTATAAAEVSLSGQGRFGLVYDNARPIIFTAVPPFFEEQRKTQISARLRFDIDASTSTDAGVTFGGRIRMQWDDGDPGAQLSPGMLYASANGFRMEVGNVNTAFDSAGLLYASQIGFTFQSKGDPFGRFYGYSSREYLFGEDDRMGVAAIYSTGDMVLRASYVTPDQTTDDFFELRPELAVSADYRIAPFQFSAAYVWNGLGDKNNDHWFLGAQYAVNRDSNIGLLVYDNGYAGPPVFGAPRIGRSVTLYGNTFIDAVGVQGYVSHYDNNFLDSKIAFGLGASLEIGGAVLRGAVHRGFDRDTYADLGVNFNF